MRWGFAILKSGVLELWWIWVSGLQGLWSSGALGSGALEFWDSGALGSGLWALELWAPGALHSMI
jgi:hypothetical protein